MKGVATIILGRTTLILFERVDQNVMCSFAT